MNNDCYDIIIVTVVNHLYFVIVVYWCYYFSEDSGFTANTSTTIASNTVIASIAQPSHYAHIHTITGPNYAYSIT